MKTYRLQTIVLAGTMLLSALAIAQQEVAPDHFDGTPAPAVAKARVTKHAKPSAARKSVASRNQGKVSKDKERQIAMAGK